MGLDAMFETRDRFEKQDVRIDKKFNHMDILRNDEIDYEINRLLKD